MLTVCTVCTAHPTEIRNFMMINLEDLIKIKVQPQPDSRYNGTWYISDEIESRNATSYYWANATETLIPEQQFYVLSKECIPQPWGEISANGARLAHCEIGAPRNLCACRGIQTAGSTWK